MKTSILNRVSVFVLVVAMSGCASYRVSSNVPDAITANAASNKVPVISEDGMTGRKFMELGPVEVSIKKLTLFHKDPTREMATEALAQKAQIMGADAVINTKYKTGIGFTTWGYIDASGMAIKMAE